MLILHACFDTKESVVRAVESLTRHGVNSKDITLILPQPQTRQEQENLVSALVRSRAVDCPIPAHRDGAADTQSGIGLGFGSALLDALCCCGIRIIAASDSIIASASTASIAIGAVGGGIYGYLIERDVPHRIAEALADHISVGGAALSITTSAAYSEESIGKIVLRFDGRVIDLAF